MFAQILKSIVSVFSSTVIKGFGKATTSSSTKSVLEHTFRKFPTEHADKAVRAAFKVGIEVGKKVLKK